MPWPWNPGQRSLKVIGIDTDRSATYDFLLTFHSNHGPILYRFWDKRWFQSKIAKFSHPRVFCVHAGGIPLGIGYQRLGSKKLEWRGYRDEKRFTICWAVWIQYTNVTDRRTYRQTHRQTDGRQQRPRLRIAAIRGIQIHSSMNTLSWTETNERSIFLMCNNCKQTRHSY